MSNLVVADTPFGAGGGESRGTLANEVDTHSAQRHIEMLLPGCRSRTTLQALFDDAAAIGCLTKSLCDKIGAKAKEITIEVAWNPNVNVYDRDVEVE